MMKITALNETNSDNNEDEFTVSLTKEAQEQIALNEYNQALELIIKNRNEEALEILEKLLNTEILDKIETPKNVNGRTRPMLSLKYSCFKNIANILDKLGNDQDSLNSYWEASKLDDTDVMLWYKIGSMAMKVDSLELACLAFKEGLKRNSNHWPCLDNIITVLYAIPDYLNCLFYISKALMIDPNYIKGLYFCQNIFRNISYIQDYYKFYNYDLMQDSLVSTNCDHIFETSSLTEANNLHEKCVKSFRSELNNNILIDLFMNKSLTYYTWLELGESLIDMYKYINENKLNFMSKILFRNSDIFESYDPSKNCSLILSHDQDQVKNELIVNRYYSIIDKDIEKREILEKNSNASAKEDYDIMEVNKPKNDDFCSSIIQFIDDMNVNVAIHRSCENESIIANVTCRNKEECVTSPPSFSKKSLNKKNEGMENTDGRNTDELNSNQNKDFKRDEKNTGSIKKERVQKMKKRRRSSLCILKQWAWSNSTTKRSSRGRISNRKDYGDILEETLKQILPSTLLPGNPKCMREESVNTNEDSMDTMDLYYALMDKGNHSDEPKSGESSKTPSPINKNESIYFGTGQENMDVNKFIKENHNRSNIIIMISRFIGFLSTKWNDVWPVHLSEVYTQLYLYVREHLTHPSLFDDKNDSNSSTVGAEAKLLFCELYTDKWLSTESHTSPQSDIHRSSINILLDDLGYIIFCKNQESCNSNSNFFLLRTLWLESNIFLYQGDIDVSLKTLKLLLLHTKQTNMHKPFLKLPNSKYNSIISESTVQKMLTYIQRSKKFCKIKYLYHEKNYAELASILKDTFSFSKQHNQSILCKELPIDRIEHFYLLQDSLWQLEQYEDCYVWAEACLNESWQCYLQNISNSANEEVRTKWIQSIVHALEKLDACVLETGSFIVKFLPEYRQSRIVQNLVSIICYQLDVLDNTPTMIIESVSPWILLHSILQYEEDKQRAKSVLAPKYRSCSSITSESDEEDDDIPACITILLKAHEFLGRHGWCCINEGKLLIFILKHIIPKLSFPIYSTIKAKLKIPLEQIIYCLYGHPVKISSGIKSKPKYLDEHVKNHMHLTWEACQLLFEFYKPENLPSFESKRVDSINSDTVYLFKKICTIIPQESDPTLLAEELNAHLMGKKDEIPKVEKSLDNKISYIYYLIADHYFKTPSNQSWLNAIKYYTFDLCLHPNEVNSWAGLAMSTSTMMETWLNNFQPNINDEKYLTKATIAQQSYQHAIDLAPSHLTIWTEFGNFLYTVHSFCSRLLKQESDSLSMERFRVIENRKDEMLDKAKYCFASAYNIYTACQGIDEPQDERWLYQYMLGKIAEKKNEDPPLFLKHYNKASELLYHIHAQYPKRISHKNPQNLAIEALEIYYRIHASILKYLEQHEGKSLKRTLAHVFDHYLKTSMQSPFVNHNSMFRDISYHEGVNNQTSLRELKLSVDFEKTLSQNTELIRKNKLIDENDFASRKRCSGESPEETDVKKVKLNNVSHLQLMQDVVGLIDDLISKVCLLVSCEHLNLKYQSRYDKLRTDSDYYTSRMEITKENLNNQDLMNDSAGKEIGSKQKKADLMLTEDSTQRVTRPISHKNLQTENFEKLEILEEGKNIDNSARTLYRRCSQESSTTTQTSTTETNNTTSSSSEDSSTSDDSSDSSSSTETDSDTIESDVEKKKIIISDEDTYFTDEETKKLMLNCLEGLEKCLIRFPEHYKSIYRLAHFFFHNKLFKNTIKSKQLLLGTYECQFHPNQTIQGLFADRKNANFFNGIWRIPIHEIDRPGSFASHMSRCISLLMLVLKETSDSRMLTELCIQLRKTPDIDKKYLRDSERKQLSYQALTLCLQCLRSRIKNANIPNSSTKTCTKNFDDHEHLLLDIYYTYTNMKNIQEYEIMELPKIRKLLEDAYTLYIAHHNTQGNLFEQAKEYCRQRVRAIKTGIASNDLNVTTPALMTTTLFPAENIHILNTLDMSLTTQNQKFQKISVSGRPRGRPPGMNKFSQIFRNDIDPAGNFSGTKNATPGNGGTARSTVLSEKSCSFHPLLESNTSSNILNSGIDANVVDSAISYFNQIGVHQDILQQYQDNFNHISRLVNYNTKTIDNPLNIHILNNRTNSSGNMTTVNDRPDVSITPITTNICRIKPADKSTIARSIQKEHSATIMQLPKSLQIKTLSPQLSLLQPSRTQHRNMPPIANQVSLKSHSTSPLHSIGTNQVLPLHTNQSKTEILTDQSALRSSISLQHKLLYKKRGQPLHQLNNTNNHVKKSRKVKTTVSNSLTHLLSCVTTSVTSNLNATVTTMSSNFPQSTKQSLDLHKTNQSREPSVPMPSSSTHSENNAHTLTVLSQLQQNSHLEIIPQVRHTNLGIDVKNIPKSTFVRNSSRIMSLQSIDSVSVYGLPRQKLVADSSTRNKKPNSYDVDDVEIITLDD